MQTDLDLRTLALPDQLIYKGRDLAPEVLKFIDATVPAWTAAKQLSERQGYGFVSTKVVPLGGLDASHWNDPRKLLGYGIAAHGAAAHYPWNVLRKMRMLARARQMGHQVPSSLELARLLPGFARDAITEEERKVEKAGGLIRWGDFPYGGAVYRSDGVREVMLGFSIWLQEEDHRLAGATADRTLELAAAAA